MRDFHSIILGNPCLKIKTAEVIFIQVSDLARAGWKPNGAHSPGQAKRHPGFSHSRVSAPCKGKSFNPLCCYSCLIADLAVLKWNTVCIFCSILAPCLKAFALTGRDCSNTRYPGCRFACPGLCATLGFQPALVKSKIWIIYYANKWRKIHKSAHRLWF